MKRGFTLIELMVVITIIGILAAIALPMFTDVTSDAKVANVQGNLASLRTSIEMFNVKNEGYPAYGKVQSASANNNEEADISGSGELSEKFGAFYSKSIMPETPASKDVSATNQVVEERDNTGGWLYIEESGHIYANLKNGNYTGDELNEVWNEEYSDPGDGGNPGDGDYDFITGEDLKKFIKDENNNNGWYYDENGELIYNGSNSGKGELEFTQENTGLSEINEINIESKGKIDSLTGFDEDSYTLTLVPGSEYIYNITFNEPQPTPVSTGIKWNNTDGDERAISGIEFK